MSRPRVLVVGGGGREHALVHALARASSKPELWAAPGNPGIAAYAECLPIGATDVPALVEAAVARRVDLVVVGPEAPLSAGLADALIARGVRVFGPSQAAARLEGSKSFAKEIMLASGVPTAESETFESLEPALAWSRARGGQVAVKADGLAAGKGVVVAEDEATAEAALRSFLGGALGDAGRKVVLEERLEGEEVSVLALCDGTRALVLPAAQDHKRVGEGDTGPNTGGMGAYSPPPCATPALLEEVRVRALEPVLATLSARGTPFVGVLYAGVMLTKSGLRVLEYNARFGDPEAQVILPRLPGDLYTLLVAAADGHLDGMALDVDPRAAITVVLASEGYPEAPRTGDVLRGLGTVPAGVTVYHAGTRVGADGQLETAGGRVLAVTALGVDLRAARDLAYAGVAAIDGRGLHHRRDIAWRALGRS